MNRKFVSTILICIFSIGVLFSIAPIMVKADTKPVCYTLFSTQTGTINAGNPEDFYSTIVSNKAIKLVLTGLTDDLDLYVYRWIESTSTLEEIASSVNGGTTNEEINIFILENTELIVEVRRYGTAVSGYTLNYESSQIYDMEVPDYDYNMVAAGKSEFYSIKITSSIRPLNITVKDFTTNLNLYVYHVNRSLIAQSAQATPGLFESVLLTSSYLDGRTVIVEVRSASASSDSFEIFAKGPWIDLEPNNLKVDANALFTLTNGYGEIHNNLDVDVYESSLSIGGRYLWVLRAPNANLRFTIFESDYSTIVAQKSLGTSTSLYFTYNASADTTLYARVDSMDGTYGEYQLELQSLFTPISNWGVQRGTQLNYTLKEGNSVSNITFKINEFTGAFYYDFALVDYSVNGTIIESKPMWLSDTLWKTGGYECYFKSLSISEDGINGIVVVPLMLGAVNMTWMKASFDALTSPSSSSINGTKLTAQVGDNKMEFQWTSSGILIYYKISNQTTVLTLMESKDFTVPPPSGDQDDEEQEAPKIDGYSIPIFCLLIAGSILAIIKKRKIE